MVDIRFHCPSCRGKLVVDSAAAGHHATCPHCAKRLTIPRPGEAATLLPTPSVPSLAPGVFTTTQKIHETRAPSDTRLPPPPPVALPKPAPDPALIEARQRLTDIMQGLQRENADLKDRLRAAEAATAELATLRTQAEALRVENAALTTATARIPGLEAARTSALERAARAESAAMTALGELDATRERLARAESEARTLALQRDLLQTDLVWLRQRMRAAAASPEAASIAEQKLLRKVTVLQETLQASEAVCKALRTRIGLLETDALHRAPGGTLPAG